MAFQNPIGVPFSVESASTGALYYRNSAGILVPLNPGANGNVLTLDSGLPTWAAAPGGGTSPTVNVGASKTFGISDANSIQNCTNSAATDITLTVPNDATANLPVGSTIDVIIGTGLVQLDWEAGVAFDNQTPVGIRRFSAQYSSYVLFKIGANSWVARNYTFRPFANTIIPRLEIMALQPAVVAVSGSGASVTPHSNGFVQLSCGTSTTGRAHIGGVPIPGGIQMDHFDIAGKCVYFAVNAWVNILSDATQTYVARAGLLANISTATPNAGFYISHSTANSGNWQVIARNSGTETAFNTAIPATTATLFEFLIKDGVGRIFVNGTEQTLITTNIPSGSSNQVNFSFGNIIKSVGTTQRLLYTNTLSICRWL